MAPKSSPAAALKAASASVSLQTRNWDSLRQRADFLRLQEQGQKWVTPVFIVYAKPAEVKRPQVGLTVTKKLGGAVIRNRIRRRLRAAADKVELPLWQISLIARSEALNCDFNELTKNLQWALKRLAVKHEEIIT